ncbi:hypothetical protein CYLTODRAFT_488022 [Cylindrobasidium torrendii FP15055 ss-10]|uniref:Uncharacterized protein n=1 Tax=Cylindrobasidium torrendii FP15055 ss-10 TaxID=1314674 RepID=A0A0D7BJ35_9AGAR|nr:hypothetical protein CYLTODRAFT_488022 [Cylindrobasidium torrendii FP15055 ss-10]
MATSISEAYFPSEDEEDSEYNAGSDSEDGKFISDSGDDFDEFEGKDAKFPKGYPLYAYPAGLDPQTPPRRATSRTSKRYAYPLIEQAKGHNSSITSGQPDYDKIHRVRHWVSYGSNNTSKGRHELRVLEGWAGFPKDSINTESRYNKDIEDLDNQNLWNDGYVVHIPIIDGPSGDPIIDPKFEILNHNYNLPASQRIRATSNRLFPHVSATDKPYKPYKVMIISVKMRGKLWVWRKQDEHGEWVDVKQLLSQPLEGVVYYTSANPAFIMFTAGKTLSKYKGILTDIENWEDLPKYQQNLLSSAWAMTAPMFLPHLGFEPFRKGPMPPIVLVESLAERTSGANPAVSSTLTRSKTRNDGEVEFAEFPVEKHNNDPEWLDPAEIADDWYDPIDDWGRRLLPEAQSAGSRLFLGLPPSPPTKAEPKRTAKRKTRKETVEEKDEDEEGSEDDRSTTPTPPPANKKSRKTAARPKSVATSRKAQRKGKAK